jgi:ribose transport system substrate-binding protein
MSLKAGRSFLGVVLVAAVSLLISAYGGSSTKSGTEPGRSASVTTPQSVIAAARSLVKALSTPDGSYSSPPTSGPHSTSGKKMWVIGLGNLTPASVALEAAWKTELAPVLHWHVTYVDGKLDPNTWLAAIRNAVNAKADGIVLQYIDCASVKSGLLAAKQAHIPVIAISGQDCHPSLFTGNIATVYGNFIQENIAQGVAQASWIIADSKGTANVVALEDTENAGIAAWTHSFAATMAKCTGCNVTRVPFTLSDLGPALQQKVQQALVQDRSATYVYSLVDDTIPAGVESAVLASGLKVKVVGFDCEAPALKYMQQGKDSVCFDYSPAWEAFASADSAIRAFAHAPQTQVTGRGMRIVTRTVNFPSSLVGYPDPAINFRKIYETTWGVR